MVVFSALRSLSLVKPAQLAKICKRFGSHERKMDIQPSRYGYHQFKDFLYFYTLVGAVPLAAIAAYANIFVGPAQLAEIPEGYDPKDEEYHRNPVTRWIVRNSWANYRENYEKMMHVDYVEYEKMALKLLTRQVEATIIRNDDVRGYMYKPVMSKVFKFLRSHENNTRSKFGSNS